METINKFLKNFGQYITLKNVTYGVFILVGAYVAFKKAKNVAIRNEMKTHGVPTQARVMPASEVITQQMVSPVPQQQGVGGYDYAIQIKTLNEQLARMGGKLQKIEGENVRLKKWAGEMQKALEGEPSDASGMPRGNMPNGVDEEGNFYFGGGK